MPRFNRLRFLHIHLLLLAALLGTVTETRAEELRIAVLGDSLSAGLGLKKADSFPSVLERELRARGHRITVLNHGVSGDTTAGGRARLDWLLQDKPHIVLIELGGNDVLRGLSAKQTKEHLHHMISTLKHRRVVPLLTGMRAPPNLGRDYAKTFHRLYRDLAKTHDITLYPFFLEGVAGHTQLNQPDGVHPNEKGVKMIVQSILPTVVETLAKVKKSRPSSKK